MTHLWNKSNLMHNHVAGDFEVFPSKKRTFFGLVSYE